MATKTINIPTSFITSVNQFMQNVQKMQQLTTQFQYQVQNLPNVQQMYQAHAAATSQFQRLLQVFRKASSVFDSAISSVVRAMGTAGRYFVRGITLFADAFGPIIAASVSAITIVGTAAISAATTAAWAAKWFWNKMVGLGDAMLEDWLLASGSLSSIGGVRAFRTAFAGLPQDPGMFGEFAKTRGDPGSRQFLALRLLGVRNFKDTADMMAQATILAAKFMKKQTKGTELAVAEAFGLTQLFTPEYLFALREMDMAEIEQMEKLYYVYKDRMRISNAARMGWIQFAIQLQATKARIYSIIAEELANPNSNLVRALTQLSQSVAHFIKVIVDSPVTEKLIKFIQNQLDRFGKWLSRPETADTILKFINNIKDIAKDVIQCIRILKDIIQLYTGKPFESPGVGRRDLGRRLGIHRPPGVTVFRPGIRIPGRPAPSQEPAIPGATVFRPGTRIPGRPAPPQEPAIPGATVFRPGRRGHPAVQIPGRPSPVPRTGGPGAAPGAAPYQPAGLRVPKTAAEAPETVEAAVKGGYRRLEGTGLYDRTEFKEELARNPALRQKIQAIAIAESGSNPDAQTALVESMMNRAKTRHQTLAQVAKWTDEPGGYYDGGGRGRGNAGVRGSAGATANSSIDRALGGSRIVGPATDNASNIPGNNLADRDMAGGKFKFIRKMPNGEHYFTRNSEDKARRALESKSGGGGLQPLKVEDIQRGLNEESAQSKTNVPLTPEQKGAPVSERNATYQSNLDYLTAHGGHSTIDMRSVPAGTPNEGYRPINPEFAARLRAAGEAYERETGQAPRYGELTRDAATQAVYYQRYRAGTGGIAAPPGRSRHQFGEAGDLPDTGFRRWLYQGNAAKYGLHFPVRGDAPHVQPNWNYSGQPFYTPSAAAVAAPQQQHQSLRPFPEKGAKPVGYVNLDELRGEYHPVDEVKVDNRSNEDIVVPKTDSDNDQHGPTVTDTSPISFRQVDHPTLSEKDWGEIERAQPPDVRKRMEDTRWKRQLGEKVPPVKWPVDKAWHQFMHPEWGDTPMHVYGDKEDPWKPHVKTRNLADEGVWDPKLSMTQPRMLGSKEYPLKEIETEDKKTGIKRKYALPEDVVAPPSEDVVAPPSKEELE